MAATVLLKTGGLTLEPRYAQLARESLRLRQPMKVVYPLGFALWLQALSYDLAHPQESALVGEPSAADTHALPAVLRNGYRPHLVVALGSTDQNSLAVPILRHRTAVDGRAAAYVCVKMVCQPPETRSQSLQTLLGHASNPKLSIDSDLSL